MDYLISVACLELLSRNPRVATSCQSCPVQLSPITYILYSQRTILGAKEGIEPSHRGTNPYSS